MISQEMNDRLTRVGAGTPMGEMLRRYWHPIGALQELLAEPVQPVRILAEDLTLFRTLKGELGLIAKSCAHRAISLAYGIPQENGLRCAYHGWTYNTEGKVIDMPFEPACLPLKVKSYAVQELGGLIWAYLGPEPAPLLPRWEQLVRTDLNKSMRMRELPANWLQCMDNSLDPVHFEHLHGHYQNYWNKKNGLDKAMNPAPHVKIDFDVFEYGIYKRRLTSADDEANPPDDWTTGHPIIFPNTLVQGTGEAFGYQIRVPTDDTHTLHLTYFGRPYKEGEERHDDVTLTRSEVKYNRFGLVDEGGILPEDEMVWIGQGPISNRTIEHLATSDKGVILYHKLLLENIEKVERGEDPMAVIRDPGQNEPWVEVKRETTGYQAFRINRDVVGTPR